MPGFLHVTPADLATVGPETVLCVLGIALVLLDAFARSLRPALPVRHPRGRRRRRTSSAATRPGAPSRARSRARS